jgi:hypothetical protein
MKDQPVKGAIDKDLSMLSYKIAKIDGFSIFCDYENIDDPKNGAIDLKLLESQASEKIWKGSEFQKLLN